MRQKALLAVVALVALVLVGAPTAFAGTNLLTNGSFETGDFTGWTTGGNFGATGVTSGAFYVYSGAEDGQFYTYMGPGGQRWNAEPDVRRYVRCPLHLQLLVRLGWR